jgi:hypothetical protein
LFLPSRTQPATYDVDDTNCNELCTGDASLNCGSASYVSVYKSPVHTLGFRVAQEPVGNVTAGDTATFALSYYLGEFWVKIGRNEGYDRR